MGAINEIRDGTMTRLQNKLIALQEKHTRTQIAEAANLAQRTPGSIINGETRGNIQTAQKICAAFPQRYDDLLLAEVRKHAGIVFQPLKSRNPKDVALTHPKNAGAFGRWLNPQPNGWWT